MNGTRALFFIALGLFGLYAPSSPWSVSWA